MFSKALVSIFAALFFCTAIGAQQSVVWQKIESKEGKFSLLFPCEPKMSSSKVTNGTLNTEQVYLSCSFGDVFYIVSYTDYPAGINTKTELDKFRDDVATSFYKSRVVSEKIITPWGSPGREFSTRSDPPDEAVGMWRGYFVGSRLYGMGVAKRASIPKPMDDVKFFASFALQK